MKVVATTWFFSPMVTSWEAGTFRVYPSTWAVCSSSVMVHLVPTGSWGPETATPSALTFSVSLALLSQV